jgi:hypothetical protein
MSLADRAVFEREAGELLLELGYEASETVAPARGRSD